jgi:galactose-1-phosphate uridylyltransferase
VVRSPLTGTPEDTFGRVEGSHCITASNIAKYDGFHGLVIFNTHHPLLFDEEAIIDYLEVGRRWAELAHQQDSSAIYYLFMWNCLWRSGASIPHGHAQISLTRGMHYAKVEALRRAIAGYRQRTGRHYTDDLWRVHAGLGLGHERHGCRVMPHLTPIKEKETLIVGRAADADFARAIHEVLRCYVDQLGVVSFNLVVYQPPPWVASAPEDWSDFPVMARIVDRGNPINRTSDFGSMELYASSVIASDPFRGRCCVGWG